MIKTPPALVFGSQLSYLYRHQKVIYHKVVPHFKLHNSSNKQFVCISNGFRQISHRVTIESYFSSFVRFWKITFLFMDISKNYSEKIV